MEMLHPGESWRNLNYSILAACAYTALKISLGFLQQDWALHFCLIHAKVAADGDIWTLGFWIRKVCSDRGNSEEFIEEAAWKLSHLI